MVCLVFALTEFGCSKKDGDNKPPAKTEANTPKPSSQKPDIPDPGTAKPGTTPAKKPEGIEIRSIDGKVVLILQTRDSGYRIVDETGKKAGRIKIEGDKIKLRDAAGNVTKARRTGRSFRVYSGEYVALRAKHRGRNKYKLRTGEDTVMGKIKGAKATLANGEKVTVTRVGETMTVVRAGKPLFTVTRVKPRQAVFLGLTEITLYQRIAAMLASAR